MLLDIDITTTTRITSRCRREGISIAHQDRKHVKPLHAGKRPGQARGNTKEIHHRKLLLLVSLVATSFTPDVLVDSVIDSISFSGAHVSMGSQASTFTSNR
jgi:hypothetical protein